MIDNNLILYIPGVLGIGYYAYYYMHGWGIIRYGFRPSEWVHPKDATLKQRKNLLQLIITMLVVVGMLIYIIRTI